MNMKAAIETSLIESIVAKCGISKEDAKRQLKLSRAVAKDLGLTVAEVLNISGLV